MAKLYWLPTSQLRQSTLLMEVITLAKFLVKITTSTRHIESENLILPKINILRKSSITQVLNNVQGRILVSGIEQTFLYRLMYN